MAADRESEHATISFPLLKHVRAVQNLHGLKHADYKRYRHYCSSRLSKLRSLLKFKQGRHRFARKELKQEMVTDARWLELILLGAERAWAVAHEIKAEMAKQGFEHTSKRRHKLRRLAKARKAAEALSKAAGAAPTDDQTKLECRCYEDSMAALELFEKGADAEEAASRCLRLQEDTAVLSSVGDAESRAAAKACGQQGAALLRLVMHRLERERGATVSKGDVARLPEGEDLRNRVLSGRAAHTRVADPAPDSIGEKGFTWLQETFAVDSEDVQARLAAASDKLAKGQRECSTAEASGRSNAAAAVAALLDTAVPLYDGAIKEMSAALALLEAAQAAGEEEGAGDVGLLAAVAIALGETRIERFALQMEAVVHKFRLNMEHSFAGRKQHERGARPVDTIRLFDGLHKASADLEAAASSPGLPAAMVQRLVATSAASVALYAAGRRVFIAQLRLGRGEAALAAALLEASEAELEKAGELSGGLEGAWRAGGPQRRLLEALRVVVAAWHVVAVVEASQNEGASESALAHDLQKVTVSDKAPSALRDLAGSDAAAADLLRYEPLGTFGPKKASLFRIESLLESAPMRPITLDTAEQFIVEPDVLPRLSDAERAARRQNQQSSFVPGFSSFKSLFSFRGS